MTEQPTQTAQPAATLEEEIARIQAHVEGQGGATPRGDPEIPPAPGRGKEDENIRWACTYGRFVSKSPTTGTKRHPSMTELAWCTNLAFWATFPERREIRHNDAEALADRERIEYFVLGFLKGYAE